MMPRVSVTIEVNCDPMPGFLYDPEDWREFFGNFCTQFLSHYKGKITDFTVLEGEDAPHKKEQAS